MNFNAERGLNTDVMFEPQSIAGSFYFKEIFQKVPTLEAAFEKLYLWDRHSNHVGILREWRTLKITKFKTPK